MISAGMKRNTVSPSQEQPPTTNVTCLACMGRHRRHSCELQGIRGRPRKHDRRRRINKKNGTKVKACRVQPLRNRKITCQSSNALTRKASAVAATRVAVVSPTHEVNVPPLLLAQRRPSGWVTSSAQRMMSYSIYISIIVTKESKDDASD